MTISYNKTWEVMQSLEDSFNRIVSMEQMVNDLQEAHSNNDEESVAELINALKSYMPVYVRQYERASQRAWNNTVGEVRKLDNPYRNYETEDVEIDYEELQKFFEDDITEPTPEQE